MLKFVWQLQWNVFVEYYDFFLHKMVAKKQVSFLEWEAALMPDVRAPSRVHMQPFQFRPLFAKTLQNSFDISAD